MSTTGWRVWAPEARTEHARWRAPLLLAALSAIGGSMDVISFLGLNGFFTNAITGNLVLLCVHLVDGTDVQSSRLLAVPTFIAAIVLSTVLANRVAALGGSVVTTMLAFHTVLLTGFMAICVTRGPFLDPNASSAVSAALVGVVAMAVQNAMVQISFAGSPSTAVMTGNVARFAMDVSSSVLRGGAGAAEARERAVRSVPALLGFVAGGVLAAALEASIGLWAILLPLSLSVLAVVLAFEVEQRPGNTDRSCSG